MIVDGTDYHDDTPPAVVSALEHSRKTGRRICLRYGDRETGRDWGDLRMCGRIGRSTGSSKIPLLIKTRRSTGGEAVLDNCIVLITEAGTKRVLFKHPSYDAAGWKGR